MISLMQTPTSDSRLCVPCENLSTGGLIQFRAGMVCALAQNREFVSDHQPHPAISWQKWIEHRLIVG